MIKYAEFIRRRQEKAGPDKNAIKNTHLEGQYEKYSLKMKSFCCEKNVFPL
jgi:hypothetical protein